MQAIGLLVERHRLIRRQQSHRRHVHARRDRVDQRMTCRRPRHFYGVNMSILGGETEIFRGVRLGLGVLHGAGGHLRGTFANARIVLTPRPKQKDSAEVYVGEEFVGVVFEDEDGDGSFMFEMAILSEDLP